MVRTDPDSNLPAELADVMGRAHETARAAKSKNTRLAYRSDWKDFQGYCEARGLDAIPATPGTVALYAQESFDGTWGGRPKKAGTIERRLAAIRHAHGENNLPSPTLHPKVKTLMEGIRRNGRGDKPRRVEPLRTDMLAKISATLSDDLRGIRDRAAILLAFSCALRRSEVAALDVSDIHQVPEGISVEIQSGKTDQKGEGRVALIPFGSNPETCPVAALDAWRKAAGIVSGPLFLTVGSNGRTRGRMSDKAIARAIKKAVAAVGLNPAVFSGHSARAGYVTEAKARGVGDGDVMIQTGHKTPKMIQVYARFSDKERWDRTPNLGL